jgi:hypothetical protein
MIGRASNPAGIYNGRMSILPSILSPSTRVSHDGWPQAETRAHSSVLRHAGTLKHEPLHIPHVVRDLFSEVDWSLNGCPADRNLGILSLQVHSTSKTAESFDLPLHSSLLQPRVIPAYEDGRPKLALGALPVPSRNSRDLLGPHLSLLPHGGICCCKIHDYLDMFPHVRTSLATFGSVYPFSMDATERQPRINIEIQLHSIVVSKLTMAFVHSSLTSFWLAVIRNYCFWLAPC